MVVRERCFDVQEIQCNRDNRYLRKKNCDELCNKRV